MQNKYWYKKGIKDGIPIALGYFAVSFALGIMAKKAGLKVFEAMLSSFLLNASAGGYACFEQIAEKSPYIVAMGMIIIANARYLLMSCAISQKLPSDIPFFHRLLVAFDVTDEIFAISVSVKGKLNPFYNYGTMTVAIPGWTLGTGLGVIMGNILPGSVVSALGVGLYGMFLAIIIPPAKKDRVIAGIVVISMLSSLIFAATPHLKNIDSGITVIILTVIISLTAAILFPIKEDKDAE